MRNIVSRATVLPVWAVLLLASLLQVSQEASALTAQTITFDAIPTHLVSDGSFTIAPTATSGLTVAVTSGSAGVCTVSGMTVNLVGSGTCYLYANQAGNVYYAAAPQVLQTFAVNKTAQTITFDPIAAKLVSDISFTIAPTATSGLTVAVTSGSAGVCTVSGMTVNLVGSGTCYLYANQAGNVYYAAAPQVMQTFAVNKTAQTIAFDPIATKLVSDISFTIAPTATSGLTVAVTSGAAGVCTVSGMTVNLVGSGTCYLYANQAGNVYFAAAPQVMQTFAVTQGTVAQTITFDALIDRALGDPPFQVSATASSNLAVTFSSTTTAVCTVSGDTVTIVALGTCTVAADQGGSSIYAAAPRVSRSFTVAAATEQLYYIHADQLNTPRAITRPSDNAVVWKNDNTEPFGNSAPDENPSGLGAFTYNLRFPGQYFDAETGTHYNFFRDYDPSTGRYVQSDPIGLRGGINTYAYVGGNPLSASDPSGLVKWQGEVYSFMASGVFGGAQYEFDLKSECVNNKYAYVHVYASALVTGFGAKVTGGISKIEFNDGNTEVDPYVFEGTFRMFSAGVARGVGISWSYFQLGQAFSTASLKPDPTIGYDASFGASIFGRSAVWSPTIKDCECPRR